MIGSFPVTVRQTIRNKANRILIMTPIQLARWNLDIDTASTSVTAATGFF